jgi:transposase
VREALSSPSYQVRRLLELATKWANQQESDPLHVPPCRTARQLRPDEVDDLVMAYTGGATVTELAKRLDIHRSTIGKHLRGRGIDPSRKGLSSDDVPAALELYREGRTYAQIAEKFRVGKTTVRDRLHEAGVPKVDRYGRSGRNIQSRPPDPTSDPRRRAPQNPRHAAQPRWRLS